MSNEVMRTFVKNVKDIEEKVDDALPQNMQLGGHNICTEIRQLKKQFKALCFHIRMLSEAELSKQKPQLDYLSGEKKEADGS